MKHLDVFTGIGGFALACEWAGIETIGFVEKDKFCQKVLKKRWPDVPIVGDIHDIEKIKQVVANATSKPCATERYIKLSEQKQRKSGGSCSERINRDVQQTISGGTNNLITGGFPCQPFSVAGKQRGKEDDRYLWPAMLNVIKEFKPTWVIGENVAGIINMALDTVLSDLENAGYEVQPFVIPACAVNAPHRRDRVWIVARSTSRGINRINRNYQPSERENWKRTVESQCSSEDATDTSGKGLQGSQPAESIRLPRQLDRSGSYKRPDWSESWYEVAAEFCRVDARIPNRVDRLKSLGNAIVPQVAYEILKAIAPIPSRYRSEL